MAYEGVAVIMAESEVYGVYSVILISATDVVKKIWLQTEAGAINSSGELPQRAGIGKHGHCCWYGEQHLLF